MIKLPQWSKKVQKSQYKVTQLLKCVYLIISIL